MKRLSLAFKNHAMTGIVIGGLLFSLLAATIVLGISASADTASRRLTYEECLEAYARAGLDQDQAVTECQHRLQAGYLATTDLQPEQDKSSEAYQAALQAGRTSTNLIGRVRIVKNAWQWNWPEYGTTPTAGVEPIVTLFYGANLANPISNPYFDKANQSDYSAYNQQLATQTQAVVPGLPNASIGIRCADGRTMNSTTSREGYADFTEAEVTALGCSRIDDATAYLATYGKFSATSRTSDPTYAYSFPQRETKLMAAVPDQRYAAAVMTGFRPTILGKLTDQNNQGLSGATLCLFYREPAASDTCNKEGLSTTGGSVSTGHYAIYASWGDYLQKGGQQAYLYVNTQAGRVSCGPAFSISGTQATRVDCQLNTAALSQSSGSGSGSGSSGGSGASSTSSRFTTSSSTASQAGSSASAECPDDTPAGIAIPNQGSKVSNSNPTTSTGSGTTTSSNTTTTTTSGATRSGAGSLVTSVQTGGQSGQSVVCSKNTGRVGQAVSNFFRPVREFFYKPGGGGLFNPRPITNPIPQYYVPTVTIDPPVAPKLIK